MDPDEIDHDGSPSRRWPGIGRRGRPSGDAVTVPEARVARSGVVISVGCLTPDCAGRLRFGAGSPSGGRATTCPECLQAFALVHGDVELQEQSG